MTTKEEYLALIRERLEIIEAKAKKMEAAMKTRELDLNYRWACAERKFKADKQR